MLKARFTKAQAVDAWAQTIKEKFNTRA